MPTATPSPAAGQPPAILRLFPYLLLAAIVALAGALRFWRLGAVSFTFDAAAVSNLAAQWVDQGRLPLQGMVSSAGFRNPPLTVYLISLPVWFSRDPLVLTGFVILLNLLAVAGTFWLGRRYWSTVVGLLAVLLYAVSPWAVQHSRGVLGQDLLAPGVLLLMAFLFGWFVDGKAWALSAALVTLAALIQVHLAAVSLAPLLATLVVWEILGYLRRRMHAPFWKHLAVGLTLGALIYGPYLIADAQKDWQNVRGFLTLGSVQLGFNAEVFDLALINIGGRNIHALAGPARFREFLASLPGPAYWLDRLEELLVVLAAVYLGVGLLQRRYAQRQARAHALLLLWLAMPVLFFLFFQSEVQLHYLVVIYVAPYLLLAAAVHDLYARLVRRPWLRSGLAALGGAGLLALVLWQVTSVGAIYRFVDIKHTPDGWPTPARIVREVLHTAQEYANLNDGSQVVVLCRGAVPEWDECPAVFSFLTSRGPATRILDYDDPQFRTYQDDLETLLVLTPGESLAAAELPALAQALPEASVPLRENQGAYRFFRIHNHYLDIARYLEAMAEPEDAVLLVGPGQREALTRFYHGSLPIYELPQEPPDRSETLPWLQQLANTHRRLYGLYRASEDSDPEGIVDSWLREHTYSGRETWLGPVRMVRYVLPGAREDWLVQGLTADFADQIRLDQVARSGESVESGDMLALDLAWQVLARPAADYTVFIQLLDPENQVLVQRDIPLQAGELATTGWQPGLRANTLAAMTIPAGTKPGPYRLIAGLYEPASGNRLAVGGGDFLDLGTVQVQRPVIGSTFSLSGVRYRPNLAFDEVTLEGFDRYKSGFDFAPDTTPAPGDSLDLVLEWRARLVPSEDWLLTARLLDVCGKETAALTAPLAGFRYPATQWAQGELVRGEHKLVLPATLMPGRYRLQLAIHRPDDERPRHWIGLGNVEIGSVQ